MNEIIQVQNLKKYYKDVKAVDDISFQVEKGELFGFLGVNGAGKSTTINMLCTLLTPTEGTVLINGLQLGKENEEIKRHIGVVYQDNCLDNKLTVRENLIMRGGLYETNKKILQKQMEKVCEILALSDVLKRPFGKLSGGQKRRCEIARALMHAPTLLFLDEPTTGLDPATRKSVWSTVHNLQKELQMTVFLTTHYMEEASNANHIAIIEKGHILEYDSPFALKEKFAKDKLMLTPKQELLESLLVLLKYEGLSFSVKENKVMIPIAQTLDAIEILERVKNVIEGFEVIQGTMDDVFLNATKEVKKYA